MIGKAVRLKLCYLEGCHQVPSSEATVERRGISGPGRERAYWVVRTPPTDFVAGKGLCEYIVIGPGGYGLRLEDMDTCEDGMYLTQDVMYVSFWLVVGREYPVDRFTSQELTNFAKGYVEVLERK